MHLALYRSERPERFNEIIGQKHIVRILQNQVKTDTVRQSYLFTGTRGTGKTTTARILAKAVNCIGSSRDGALPCGECENCKAIKEGNFLDVIELDAASNNSVDAIRGIIDSCQYPPYCGKYKVYIVDEVHMLSASAENAFLKILEEPPKHVIFILATTNPEKVRETIRSRCMQLDFRRVSETDLMAGMRRICDRKNINITDEALGMVAQKADGSVRDALSILEQCISGGDELLDVETVQDYIGSAGTSFFLSLTQAVIDRNMSEALDLVANMIRAGRDAKLMLNDWMEHYRNLMVSKYVEDTRMLINSSEENVNRMRLQASQLDAQGLESGIRLLSEYVNLARWSTQPRILLETAILHLMNGKAVPSSRVDELLRQMPINTVPHKPAKKAASDTLPSNVMPVRKVSAADASEASDDTFRAVPILDKNTIPQFRESPRTQEITPDTIPSNVMPVRKVSAADATEASDDTFRAVPILDKNIIPQLRESPVPQDKNTVKTPCPFAITGNSMDDKGESKSPQADSGTHESNAVILRDFDAMWSEIVEIVADGNSSFRIMVGNNSRIDEYRNGEIIIKVKSTKLKFAEDRKEDILVAARKLFGEHVFVTIRVDDGIISAGNMSHGVSASNSSTPEEGSVTTGQRKMDLLFEPSGVDGVSETEPNHAQMTETEQKLPGDPPLMNEDDYYENIGAAEELAKADFPEYPIDYMDQMVEKTQSEEDVVSEITEEVSALFGVSVKVVE